MTTFMLRKATLASVIPFATCWIMVFVYSLNIIAVNVWLGAATGFEPAKLVSQLCPHGREHHLDLLVVRRLNYACAVSGFCIFSYHSERSSTPPLIGTSLRHGWDFARLPSRLARDFSLLPGSAPRSSASRWGTDYGIAVLEVRSTTGLTLYSQRQFRRKAISQ